MEKICFFVKSSLSLACPPSPVVPAEAESLREDPPLVLEVPHLLHLRLRRRWPEEEGRGLREAVGQEGEEGGHQGDDGDGELEVVDFLYSCVLGG